MTATLLRAAGLAAIYLLVLTSLKPGDVLVGAALGLAVAIALRPRDVSSHAATSFAGPWAVVALLGATLAEMVRGTWRTARFCLGGAAEPAFVEIPREERTDGDVAVWGVLTGEAPDEIPVDVDDGRGVLVVHLLDGADPDAVRERHHRAFERARGRRGQAR